MDRERQTDRQTDRQAHRQTGRQTDAGGQTDRQTKEIQGCGWTRDETYLSKINCFCLYCKGSKFYPAMESRRYGYNNLLTA